MSACYRPASLLASVATEFTNSRGLHLSASDCAELLQQHDDQITTKLNQLSLDHCKPAVDSLSAANISELFGFNIVSVHISSSLCISAVAYCAKRFIFVYD